MKQVEYLLKQLNVEGLVDAEFNYQGDDYKYAEGKLWEEKKTGKKEKPQEIKKALFKIKDSDIVIVNLDQKKEIEIGNIQRKEHPVDNRENDINLKFIDISRQHLKLICKLSGPPAKKRKIYISAYESKHGTFVNEEKMEPAAHRELKNKDIIKAGKIVCFQFYVDDGCYLLMNVTHEKSKGSLMWLDETQAEGLPGKNTTIILLEGSISLERFDMNSSLVVNEQGTIKVKGSKISIDTGDIVL